MEEEELEKYKAPDRTPMVGNPDSPSKEERERHELTHANHRSWCRHCQRALAMRDKHNTKEKKSSKYKYNRSGEAIVPETEGADKGFTKFSMDYMTMNSEDGDRAKSTMVVVNHEDGGIFSYATPPRAYRTKHIGFPGGLPEI